MRPRPHRDPALDGKAPPPDHQWPYSWSGEIACTRCHRKASEIERRSLSCVTDAEIQQAAAAARVFERFKK